MLSVLAAACAGLWAAEAAAQALPGAADPSRVDELFQPGPEPLSEPEPEVTPGVEGPVAPEGAEQLRFVLQEIRFEGATVFSAADFQPLYADLVGTEVSIADIFTVAQRATVQYRSAGYILSQVLVPAQQVEGGVITLRVVEGFVDEVSIEGEIGGDRSILEAYGEAIQADRPLRAATLERYLLLAGDLAGAEATGVLSPSPTTPGASDLAIVLEHDPLDGFGSVDNRGSDFIGPYLATAGVTANSPFGFYEQFSLLASTSFEFEELAFVQGEVAVPVGTEGTTLSFRASASRSEPDEIFTLVGTDPESESVSGTVSVEHPFIRSREENLRGGLSFTVRDSQTEQDILGFRLTTADDRVVVARARVTYDFVDSLLGVNLLDLELSQGLDVFNATDGTDPDDTTSRANARPDFTKVNITASRLQRLAQGLGLLLEVRGQLSEAPLPSSEEFGVGGALIGRGYDPSEIVGDSGVAGKVELQYGEPVGEIYLDSFQVYGFFDAGIVWNRGGNEFEQDEDDTLTSVGAGIRLSINEYVSANFEVASQLGRGSASNDGDTETRALFSLTGRF